MKLNFKKVVALIVCLCFAFSFCFNSIIAASNDKFDKSNIKVVRNDGKACTVMATYKGDELYATINKETNEITMQAVEKSKAKTLGLPIGEDKKTTFKVKVEKAVDSEISAVATETESNKEYKISQNSDKVIAQIPIAIPLVEILGAALLEALLATLTAIIVFGITYYSATTVADSIRNKSYNYYYAVLKNDDVYIGPAYPEDAAAFTAVRKGNNVFARTDAKANEAARKGGSGMALWHTPHGGGDGYWNHYHPTDMYGVKIEGVHCWY